MDTDMFRPTYHYTPRRNFMNDPNGLVYHDGRFLLFHQFNPQGNVWGHMSWKQASSPDLVNWTHLPVALPEADGMMAFSGSAVVDSANTSGFGSVDQPPLVAIYTAHDVVRHTECPCLAYSCDRGSSWTRYIGNPVLPPEKDFRDPKVFWHEETGQWIMLIVKANDKLVRFYRSHNLRSWEYLSAFGAAGAPADSISNWECPDLLRLPIEEEPGRHAWALHIGIGDGHPAGGSGGQYFIGDFTGTGFVNANPADTVLWSDHGKDNYAAISWSNIAGPQGETYWAGWMSNWRYAEIVPTHPWRNGLTLPRLLSLRRTAGGLRLIQRPIPHLETLRREPRTYETLPLPPDTDVALNGTRGVALEIEAEFDAGNAAECGLAVRVGAHERTLIGIDALNQLLFVDRTASGVSCSDEFPGRHTAPLGETVGALRLRIFVDSGSVEVFADDGRLVLTELIFPRAESTAVYAYARGGHACLVNARTWKLAPVEMSYCDGEEHDDDAD